MAKIDWIEIDSSNVVRVGVEEGDRPGKVELYVEFKGGTQYVYHDVPEDTAQGLLDANSKGKYLNENVKSVYQFNKLSA